MFIFHENGTKLYIQILFYLFILTFSCCSYDIDWIFVDTRKENLTARIKEGMVLTYDTSCF